MASAAARRTRSPKIWACPLRDGWSRRHGSKSYFNLPAKVRSRTHSCESGWISAVVRPSICCSRSSTVASSFGPARGAVPGTKYRADPVEEEDHSRSEGHGSPPSARVRSSGRTCDMQAALRRVEAVLNDPSSVRSLGRLRRTLDGVVPWVSGRAIPEIPWTRLNARYRPAIRLARLLLDRESLELGDGAIDGRGFLLDMFRVFESFLASTLTDGGHRATLDRRYRRRCLLGDQVAGGRVQEPPTGRASRCPRESQVGAADAQGDARRDRDGRGDLPSRQGDAALPRGADDRWLRGCRQTSPRRFVSGCSTLLVGMAASLVLCSSRSLSSGSSTASPFPRTAIGSCCREACW